MPRPSQSDGSVSHLGSVPITVGFAGVVIIAIAGLTILRHLFAGVSVSTSAGLH